MDNRYVATLGVLCFHLFVGTPSEAQVLMRGSDSDVEQGADAAKLVERQIGIYSHPATEKWVQDIGAKLAATTQDTRWKFSFHILDQPEPNAFALPGGSIYISRGLLALVTSEDELAGVLGHEIAHVTERHSARQQRRGILPGLLEIPGNIVGGVVSKDLGNLINAPVKGITGINLSRYGRGQETDSDRIGTKSAASSGYDPLALATILERLERDVALQTGEERKASLFDSHPMTSSRLSDIRKDAPKLSRAPASPIAGEPAAVYAKLNGMWSGANPEAGILQQDRFMHPMVGFTIQFPAGWKHNNSPIAASSTHPKDEAALMIGIEDTNAAPDVAGQAFVRKMRTEAKIDPISIRTEPHQGMPVYMATYLDNSGRQPFSMHFVWASMGGTTYHLVAIGLEKHQDALRNAALSLRPLSTAERQAITGKRLRTATAKDGETLTQFSARTRNAWSEAYTAIANGLDPKKPLTEGRLLKIAVEEPAWTAK